MTKYILTSVILLALASDVVAGPRMAIAPKETRSEQAALNISLILPDVEINRYDSSIEALSALDADDADLTVVQRDLYDWYRSQNISHTTIAGVLYREALVLITSCKSDIKSLEDLDDADDPTLAVGWYGDLPGVTIQIQQLKGDLSNIRSVPGDTTSLVAQLEGNVATAAVYSTPSKKDSFLKSLRGWCMRPIHMDGYKLDTMPSKPWFSKERTSVVDVVLVVRTGGLTKEGWAAIGKLFDSKKDVLAPQEERKTINVRIQPAPIVLPSKLERIEPLPDPKDPNTDVWALVGEEDPIIKAIRKSNEKYSSGVPSH